jgi:arginine-tRNA-protein transferase
VLLHFLTPFAGEIHDAGAQDMQYLYMGFYIYSCAKMRYKGEYAPSYLADPVRIPPPSAWLRSVLTVLQETYDWYPIEKCIPLLKTNRYSSFSHPEHNLGPSDPLPPRKCRP